MWCYVGALLRRTADQRGVIEAIRRHYAEGILSVEQIAKRFGTSRGRVQNLVQEFGWPRRGMGGKALKRYRREQGNGQATVCRAHDAG